MIAYFDHTGRITAATSDEQKLRPGDHIHVPGFPDPEMHYVRDGQLLPRPVIAPPPAIVNLGEIMVIEKVPAGTKVEINGMSYGLTESDEPLELDMPLGVWRLSLTPPWPWMEAEFRVGVE